MTERNEARQRIFEDLQAVAASVGGTVHAYPSPLDPKRRLTLRESRTETDTQFEEAVLDADGTVYVVGADSGAGVSAVFGEEIQSYEWAFVIAPERVPDLVEALGGTAEDDVLALLAAYYERANGRLHGFLCGPEVGATFSNWHG